MKVYQSRLKIWIIVIMISIQSINAVQASNPSEMDLSLSQVGMGSSQADANSNLSPDALATTTNGENRSSNLNSFDGDSSSDEECIDVVHQTMTMQASSATIAGMRESMQVDQSQTSSNEESFSSMVRNLMSSSQSSTSNINTSS